MSWVNLLIPYPGGNRRLALQGFRASLAKIDALAEAGINDDEALKHYWPEIVEETAKLKNQLITPEEKQRDQTLTEIYSNQELRNTVHDRDGNTCQFCGETVNWEVRNNGRAGTYATLQMDKPTRNPQEIFVSCRFCAEQRKRDFKDGKELAVPLPLQSS